MEFVLGRFSNFYIAITYSNFTFCGVWTPSFVSSHEICKNFSRTSISPTVIEDYWKLINWTLQLTTGIADSEISRLSSLIGPNTMEMLALGYFRLSEAQISHSRRDNTGNSEGFNRELLHKFKNKGGSRKVFVGVSRYRRNFTIFKRI